ncbi:MAG: hypothetical protein H0V10_11480 [Geodermatophilaceae bacterium]|nr:hypothetical protein [Geodermatophilaceae bacterium]
MGRPSLRHRRTALVADYWTSVGGRRPARGSWLDVSPSWFPRDALGERYGVDFDSVLVNFYRTRKNWT